PPHQFLTGATPLSRYRTSPRLYTGTLPPIEYPGHFIVKRITDAGTFRFKKRLLFIANALKQHTIGLEEVDDGIWSIHFCRVLLGRIDERDYAFEANREVARCAATGCPHVENVAWRRGKRGIVGVMATADRRSWSFLCGRLSARASTIRNRPVEAAGSGREERAHRSLENRTE